MRSFGLAALFVLALIVANVLSDCPEGGCKCGEHCVDSGNKWCNTGNDADCSCKKGCLIYDTLLEIGKKEKVHCNTCSCPETGRLKVLSRMAFCPIGLKAGVHYPLNWTHIGDCAEQ